MNLFAVYDTPDDWSVMGPTAFWPKAWITNYLYRQVKGISYYKWLKLRNRICDTIFYNNNGVHALVFFYLRSQPCLLYLCPASETEVEKTRNIFRKKFKMIFHFPTAAEQDALSGFLSCLWVGPAGVQRSPGDPSAKLGGCIFVLLQLFAAEKENRIFSPMSSGSSKRLRATACSSVENLLLPLEIEPYDKCRDRSALISNSKAGL